MPYVSPRSADRIAHDLPTVIFIVYESHEVKLAEALKQLFQHWGIGTVYCRQEIRGLAVSEPYRQFLAEQLSTARLVIPLLSPSFQWSSYCQAEVGACATFKKPMISVIIPPSSINDVRAISPVLEGFDYVIASPSLPRWPPKKLFDILKSVGGPDRWETQNFINDLQSKILQALQLEIHGQNSQDAEEVRLRRNAEGALRSIIEDNYFRLPRRELVLVWPSIDDRITPDDNQIPSLAPISIKEHIKLSLLDPDIPTTALTFVGVSLKFSLRLITAALEELAYDHQNNIRLITVARDGTKKALQVTLVHMGDQAHILHALHDQIDIRNIVASFHEGWLETRTRWSKSCSDMGIDLLTPQKVCIDYIPPRIGILIDGSFLYAGRCSFPERGDTEFYLRAGENEYFFYDRTSPRGGKEIEQFEQYVSVYKRSSFYGVTLVPEPNRWIDTLQHCVAEYPDATQITLISQTCTKFLPLIKAALPRGLVVNVYVQHPDTKPMPAEVEAAIRALPVLIRRLIEDQRRLPLRAAIYIYYYRHQPTYRVASIGEDVLGIQMYLSRPQEAGSVTAGELRLIISKHSSKYSELQQELIERFKKGEGVSQKPDIDISMSL